MLIKNKAKQTVLWLIVFLVTTSIDAKITDAKESIQAEIVTTSPLTDKEVTTVFIHGTLFPLMSWLVHRVECAIGLTPAASCQNKYILGRIGYTLDKADKERFPLASSYLFGWSGKLCFNAREVAAEELYNLIKTKKNIRIIAHSHGCNVVANLAKIVERLRDSKFEVEELILLAPPVQHATRRYIKLPLFKKVRSFYSKGDYVQILDPQGIYKKSYRRVRKKKVPFFSERRYPASSNLVQAQVLIDDRHIGHLDFILPKFMEYLPTILKCVDSVAKVEDITQENINCVVNISRPKGKIKFSVDKAGKDTLDYRYAIAA